MSFQPMPTSQEGETISEDLFGGNLLANRGELYGEGQYDTAINDLGITTLRYPGGSRTEKSFDINNPDAEQKVDQQTGQVDDWIALSDFFEYAEDNGHPVSVVLPTRFNLSEEVDETGNRTPEFNEEELRTFIRDVATGKYGSPEIHSFEIGNEYWHSGQMNSLEYGRLASEMTDIIDDELSKAAATHPDSQNIQITVQMGYNYGDARLNDNYQDMSPTEVLKTVNSDFGLDLDESALYNDGTVNWGFINNMIIIGEFENDGTIEDVDGVIAHVYSLGEENQWSRVFELQQVQDTWMEEYPELDIHVTEWNMKGVTEVLDRADDYGLHQAEEMLNLMEEFIRVDVDYAHVWPLINFTDNALNNGWTYGDTNAPGAMFRMMADNLPGKQLLDFNPDNERVTEAEFDNLSVHGFAGEGELLLYVMAIDHDEVTSTNLDLNGMLIDFDTMELTILGVEEGAKIGSNKSSAELETIDHELVYEDGILDVSLDPGEILQVVVKGVVPTDALAPFVGGSTDADDDTKLADEGDYGDDDVPLLPPIFIPDQPIDDEETHEDDDFDDGDDWGLALLLGAIPLLGLLMFMG